MAWYERELWVGKVSVDHMQVCSTDAAGFDGNADLPFSGNRDWNILHIEPGP
jgi:hypothetical protein